MRLEFLTPDDDRWASILREIPHDFYHLPGYVRLMAQQEEGQAEAVLVSDADNYFLLPYISRRLDLPAASLGRTNSVRDIRSPYGYPGCLTRESTTGFLKVAVGAWIGALRQRGIVSGFFRLHPLFPIPAEVLSTYGGLVHRGSTVSIDLSRSEQLIWDGFRHGHRLDIKLARRRGLLATLNQDSSSLEEFISIYRETMDRVQAADFYYFPASYFQELREVLGERLWVCTVRQPNGEALASGLFVACGPIVQYHLSGTRTAARALGPNKVIIDFIWREARARGYRVLHLGGGVGSAEDSLFQFKAGFSERRHPYYTWQVIIQPDVYDALTIRRQEMAGAMFQPGFFPAYRA